MIRTEHEKFIVNAYIKGEKSAIERQREAEAEMVMLASKAIKEAKKNRK